MLRLTSVAKVELAFLRCNCHTLHLVIFGSGKDANHLANIMHSMQKRMENNTIIATRVSAEQYSVIEALLGSHAVQYRSECRIAHTVSVSQTPSNNSQTESISGSVAVLCAGTSDVAVAEEAAVLLELSGVSQVTRVYDVGVAGIHRLLSNLDKFNRADVVIVCAGMDGALPSVVGGLVQAPVIAVPTSVGYGASFQGVSALLTMLNSCAPGVTVVNIDNGFGAAVSAYKMLRLKQQNKNINNDKK